MMSKLEQGIADALTERFHGDADDGFYEGETEEDAAHWKRLFRVESVMFSTNLEYILVRLWWPLNLPWDKSEGGVLNWGVRLWDLETHHEGSMLLNVVFSESEFAGEFPGVELT
jgi:hypothetical protein